MVITADADDTVDLGINENQRFAKLSIEELKGQLFPDVPLESDILYEGLVPTYVDQDRYLEQDDPDYAGWRLCTNVVIHDSYQTETDYAETDYERYAIIAELFWDDKTTSTVRYEIDMDITDENAECPQLGPFTGGEIDSVY